MRLLKFSFAVLHLLPLGLSVPIYNSLRENQEKMLEGQIQKRDIVTVTDTAIATPSQRPEKVVYVDRNGVPVRTVTETVVLVPAAAASSAAASSAAASSAEREEAPTEASPSPSSTDSSPIVYLPDVEDLIPGSMPTALAPPPLHGPPNQSQRGGRKHGITYSPYKKDQGCKSASQVEADWAIFAKDHGTVRLYGVDCDQVSLAYKEAKKHGNKLFIGIYDIADIDGAVSSITHGISKDWDIVDTVSVGNELVNSGQKSPAESVAAVKHARKLLRAAGFRGPVVIVDTFTAMLAHPELCQQSDYCAANIHPFFDPSKGAQQAGSFVSDTVNKIRGKFPGKRVVVTETGWPWKGKSNGRARPGRSEQASALASVRTEFKGPPQDLFLFSAFNDLWKKPEERTYMAEQYWGMEGRYSPADK